jgi:hypothetical protein
MLVVISEEFSPVSRDKEKSRPSKMKKNSRDIERVITRKLIIQELDF